MTRRINRSCDFSVRRMQNHPNNQRLQELVERAGLSTPTAITLFNRVRTPPVRSSEFEAWLRAPGDQNWQLLPDDQLAHAEVAFGALPALPPKPAPLE